MNRSIRYRMTLLFIGLMAAVLFAIWAINNWWLEDYYISQKLMVMEDAYNRLDSVVAEKVAAGEDIGEVITQEAQREWEKWNQNAMKRKNPNGKFPEPAEPPADEGEIEEPGETEEQEVDENSLLYTIRDYGEKNNIAIVMVDSATGKALLASGNSARDGDWLAQKVQRYILGFGNDQSEVLKAHENYTVEKNFDPRSQSSYMESWGFFSDDSTLFIMSMPLASIRDSVMLSNRFTTFVGVVALLIGSVLMYFVTRRVTNPIMKLASLSERMSHLDFTVRYEGNAQDEVGILGHSMNTLSGKLKETIGELQSANAQLQKDIEEKIQIDEMRKEFIANVSHELKTPIALIQGYAEGLTEGMCEDEESRNYYCEVIMDETAKMNKMVKQLLNLTALEFGNDTPVLEVFDISSLVADLLNSASILFQQNQAKAVFASPGPLYVLADEFKIEEALTNFISNALNHLDGERTIRVEVIRREDQVKVSVINTGNTIPEEDIKNLWTKFFKVDKARTRAYGGSGIGLSIVKAIMDAHGQSCGAVNREDGVEFWLTLKYQEPEDIESSMS